MRADVDHAQEYADFTEASYRRLLQLAKARYRFVRFGEEPEVPHVLWRHDLDASIHRALRLAEIEAEEGVTATHFVFLRCPYYNPLADENRTRLRRIAELGHDLGLHFDLSPFDGADVAEIESALDAEAEIMRREFGARPRAVSFHLYGSLASPAPGALELAGMCNAYADDLRGRYDYVSDSNGLWWHRRLEDVLTTGAATRLQVLTHPEWWTPEVMAPRTRLQRAIDGQAAYLGSLYDHLVTWSGRPNLR